MNAFQTPLSAPLADNVPPVATIVVGPTSTSMAYSSLKTGMSFAPLLANGTVTMQNAESGVSLRVGERFLLDLGERSWKIRTDREAIITSVTEVGLPVSHQGYFQAIKAGKTKLYATSDPPPLQASPPSLLPTLFLEIQVTVLP